MLVVKVDTDHLEYDIHSLVKAFYPEETVKVLTPSTDEKKRQELGGQIDMELLLQEQEPKLLIAQNKQNTQGNLAKAVYTKQEKCTSKDEIKRFLYISLSAYTGKELPWGNLTGIRPTKIAMNKIEAGETDEAIGQFMKEVHFVSDAKIRLAIEIAHREKELLAPFHVREGYSLYIGIPFCPTTCLYCSFTSYPICAYESFAEPYLDCVCREMAYVAKAYQDKVLDSVYIGGGTPTTLSAAQLERLLTCLEQTFDLSHLLEFTVEAGRADSMAEDKLRVLKAHGVSRISVNPQTMKDETLQLIGRRHTVAQVKEAFAMARAVGFDNINMDIILGLPGEDPEDVRNTIQQIQKLDPDSLTVHSLAIKRASKLRHWIEANGISCLKNTDETMAIASEGAQAMGMQPYYLYRQKNMSGNFENVGYAKPGKFGIYNILIMEELQTIMALGAGSISKIVLPDGRIERADNVKDVKLYIEKIEEMLERKENLFSIQRDEGWLDK
jgi:oxygen-independent coproporphyrinogen-3 oxidase